tara:strand:+ start:848 stop:1258 length:411 start_codon:yes stop_codon:yes gene_type:complete
MSKTTMHQSSIAKTFPTLPRRQLMLGCVALLLLNCDIPYVAEGSWDVVYELPGQQRSGVWHISEENGMNVEGELNLQIDEFELAGSRMYWSAITTNLLEPARSVQRLNFNGTVNGNRFAGTLYTQSGNLTITGIRQ